MVIIEQCRIDSEGTQLIIEAEVENLEWYKDVFIDSVFIETEATNSNTPASSPIIEGIHKKKIKYCINAKDIGKGTFNDSIFYVYIRVTGVPSIDCPCGMDREYTLGIAVNMRPIYNQAMQFIRELDNTCDIPRGFIDMILRLKAFELSLKTGNFIVAQKQLDRLFKNKVGVVPSKNCGCRWN